MIQSRENIQKFYVTTPIYYVNDVPHIGHAYTMVLADVLARWHRLRGDKVFFLTGTDEHGAKIEKAAQDNHELPQDFVDKISEKYKDSWQKLNISYNRFLRTTEESHSRAVTNIINRIWENGDIYKGEYEGWYCVPDETFLTNLQLIKGACPFCGREVKRVKEEAYFFRLSKYKDALLKLYAEEKSFLAPDNLANEIIARVSAGLKDLDITRTTVKWAIAFPKDKEHYVYVWVDALTNYLSGLDWPESGKFEEFWPPTVQIVGKEINWFHAVIWPSMLLSAGLELPKTILAHGWWTVNGEKMSKSKGNVVDPVKIVEKYSADALRYFFVREMPIGSDGNFSETNLINRINNELVADLGNFLNRVVTMAEKFDGTIAGTPELESKLDMKGIMDSMAALNIYGAIEKIWEFLRAANKYVNDNSVWSLEGAKKSNALYNLLESARIIAILISPFMPETAQKISMQLGVPLGGIDECKFAAYAGKVTKGEYLFQKIRR